MPLDLARLRSIARGEIAPKTGVTPVTALQSESVTPEKARCNASNARNASKIIKGENRFSEAFLGVAEGVSWPLRQPRCDPETHRCGCGEVAVIGVGWFLRDQSRARWLCAECYRTDQRKGD